MNKWTFLLQDNSEVTFWEHAITCIHWRRSMPNLPLPDSCRVVLSNGQMIDLLRDNARRLYLFIVGKDDEIKSGLKPEKKGEDPCICFADGEEWEELQGHDWEPMEDGSLRCTNCGTREIARSSNL